MHAWLALGSFVESWDWLWLNRLWLYSIAEGHFNGSNKRIFHATTRDIFLASENRINICVSFRVIIVLLEQMCLFVFESSEVGRVCEVEDGAMFEGLRLCLASKRIA